MEGFVIFLIAAVVLLIITATYSIPIINSVERAKARVDEALSNVDVALTRRYDQTSQLAAVADERILGGVENLTALVLVASESERLQNNVLHRSLRKGGDFSPPVSFR